MNSIDRAVYLMDIAAQMLETHAGDATTFYDDAQCDGTCLAMDLRDAILGLQEDAPK